MEWDDCGYDELVRHGIKVRCLFKITDILNILLSNNLLGENQMNKCLNYIKKERDLDILKNQENIKLEDKLKLNDSLIYQKIIN